MKFGGKYVCFMSTLHELGNKMIVFIFGDRKEIPLQD